GDEVGPGALVDEALQRHRRVQGEVADPGTAQRGEVSPDAQRGAEVAGQGPDVGAGAHLDLDVHVGGAGVRVGTHGEHVEAVHGDAAGREVDLLTPAHAGVGAPPPDLDRADRAGHLVDLAGEPGDRGADGVVVEVAGGGP